MILFLSSDNLNSKQGHGGLSFKTWDFIPQNDAILSVIFMIHPLTWTASLRTHKKLAYYSRSSSLKDR